MTQHATDPTGDPVVETSAGRIRGAQLGALSVFRGIPYAEPPVGDRRFCPPEPHRPWAGVRDAHHSGPAAAQNPSAVEQMMGGAALELSEDSLTLNVWTPGCDGTDRPVMVWIHGGGFETGMGSMVWYDGANLAARDVVVVTLNYRLGAFGFGYLDGVVDGATDTANLGLRDQIAALTWVRDNIAAFGGDPDQVTVFGESAGSMSIACLLAVPAAKGLFHRAILQSGSWNMVASAGTAQARTRQLLTELGVDPTDGLVGVQQVPTDDLLAAQARIGATTDIDEGLPWTPVVDGEVLPRHPAVAIADGDAADVDVLIGTTTEEMKMFLLLEPALQNMTPEALAERADALFVPAGRAPGEALDVYRRRLADEPTPELVSAVLTDHTFRIPSIRLAEAQVAHNPNVWMYLFGHHSPAFGGIMGASHALELVFVWDNLDQPGAQMYAGEATDELRSLAGAMADAWVAFARDGAPAAPALPPWPRYDLDRRATAWLEPGACRVEDDPWADERRLWDGVTA